MAPIAAVRVKAHLDREEALLADPSSCAALLGASSQRLLTDLNTLGFLFEALAAHDIRSTPELGTHRSITTGNVTAGSRSTWVWNVRTGTGPRLR